MRTAKTNQVKVTLPEELHFIIKNQADRFGMTLSSYIRTLILDDVKKQEVLVYVMSEKQEKISLKAEKDFLEGKTTEIKDIDEYLSNL